MKPIIQTYSGRTFDLLHPTVDTICLVDIAHALSTQCRYTGHTSQFYSVAQHSVLMSQWNLPGRPEDRLLHDAAEAYIGDLSSPLKAALACCGNSLDAWRRIERNIDEAIALRFQRPGSPVMVYNNNTVKDADLIMLAVERKSFMLDCPDIAWPDIPPLAERYLFEPIESWPPNTAEYGFLSRAQSLGLVPEDEFGYVTARMEKLREQL